VQASFARVQIASIHRGKVQRMTAVEALLLRAIGVARSAREHGNHPFGALLVSADDEVLLEAENTVVTQSDATGHAETNLVRLASAAYSRDDLADTAVYTSTEPCAMCAGAIYWAGIGQVVYALAESELLTMTGDDPENPTLDLSCRQVFAAGQRAVDVFGPFELAEARAVHAGFWQSEA
jgi:tRNA(Arg) A34 adenosine deaminase TadA